MKFLKLTCICFLAIGMVLVSGCKRTIRVPVNRPADSANSSQESSNVQNKTSAGTTTQAGVTSNNISTYSSSQGSSKPTGNNSGQSTGKTYYVSNHGNDNNDGLSTSKPFKTIAKVNSLNLEAGDKVLFQCGGVFNDACLEIKNIGSKEKHIIISSYGSGAKPILRGGINYDEQFALSPSRSATVAIKLSSSYNVTIKGLHLDRANFGIFMNNSLNKSFADSQLVIDDCEFTNIDGYHCLSLQETAPELPPFYSNAIEIALRGKFPLQLFQITNSAFTDCDAAMHIDTIGKAVIKNVTVDNMYREGVLFESAKAPENDPSTITNLKIRNVGVVYGKDWGTAALQFNVCRNFICDGLDLSYTGNAEFKNDMVGGDFEATNTNIVVKNSRIHNNGGEGWLIYRTPGWGKDNKNISFINNVWENNGLKDKTTAAFLRHYYNENAGGEIKNNRIWLAYTSQFLNFINPTNTNSYPKNYDISGNSIMGVYRPSAEPLPNGTVYSFDFDKAFDYEEWYGYQSVRWSYQNGLYLTTVISKVNGLEPEIISKEGLKLDLSSAKTLKIRLKNKTTATAMRIYFADENGNFSEKYITISITAMNDDFVEYTVPISNLKKINRIKIQPAVGASDGWLQYDYIRFLS